MAVAPEKPTQAVEDYIKAVYVLIERGDKVTTTALANYIEVTPSSVSAMLTRLRNLGLIIHRPFSEVGLTDAGLQLALHVVRRRRLIELFLIESLGYAWDEVEQEAEVLSRAASDVFVARIDERLRTRPSIRTAIPSRPRTARSWSPPITCWRRWIRVRPVASCGSGTAIRRSCSTSTVAASSSATGSRSCGANPSVARWSSASASRRTAASTVSVTGWPKCSRSSSIDERGASMTSGQAADTLLIVGALGLVEFGALLVSVKLAGAMATGRLGR